ncbi:hypothetical protein D0B54_12050 [Solimonas sp. K1W22B-7]|uniref:hypothetical protein n=1 Tax=Solimonas sp. K1W22B-7 TaxID=2303331 RepID=UPI000E3338E2|nr:hypothetical protein [Solimonas sp. K1W22B-7]AXQ29380.1 hypothetical protein D0B54_12050 [Solimonas sp. K1W22B-7]
MSEHLDVKPETGEEGDGEGRQRSKIGFPYAPLAEADCLVKAIHDNAGTGDCSQQQLAAWLNMSIKSSGFRTDLAAARLFGVIESDGPDKYRLSPLGRRIVDPVNARKAKAEAFLNVPLFKALFEKYKEGVLPPTAALEREIAGLGVAEKQKDRARQVFERSAEQAGFFEHGKNRLVMPAVAVKDTPPPPPPPPPPGGSSGGGDNFSGLELDPLLIALLRKIPKTGEKWPEAQRLRWFNTFAMNVSQVYDDDIDPVDLMVNLKGAKNAD